MVFFKELGLPGLLTLRRGFASRKRNFFGTEMHSERAGVG